jgi:adenine-specific DNA-methyltransferase
VTIAREWCQYRTPDRIAQALASMVVSLGQRDVIRILDPGAGDGVLGFTLAEKILREYHEACVVLTLVEAEPQMHARLVARVELELERWAERLHCEVVGEDFLSWSPQRHYDIAICNPPYGKISPEDERGGVAPNLYARFMEHAMRQLVLGGAGCFVVPRSYMSGAYFSSFRETLWRLGALVHAHVFESRRIFAGVLQEIVLVHYVRTEHFGCEAVVRGEAPDHVLVSSSHDADDIELDVLGQRRPLMLERMRVVEPGGSCGVWLPTTEHQARLVEQGHFELRRVSALGVQVSTGRVIPFRVREHLRERASKSTVPLLWMQHVRDGEVAWPLRKSFDKPEHISTAAAKLLVPAGNYVLVRRVSAKEDARRIVAAPLLAGQLDAELLGIENHLNYITRPGMTAAEARELAEYLNSDEIDSYVRAGNGNTQISAAELRALPLGLGGATFEGTLQRLRSAERSA